MFLHLLQETNKTVFLKLCVHASLANDIFAEEEKELIHAYCREMNIKEHIPEQTETFEQIMEILSVQADSVEKNIIILEILGLLKADGIYDEKEEEFMKKLAAGMKVKEEVVSKYNSLLEIYLSVCKELRSSVCENTAWE